MFNSSESLCRAGGALRRVIGLSEAGSGVAKNKVGLHPDAVTLDTGLATTIRDPEQISSWISLTLLRDCSRTYFAMA